MAAPVLSLHLSRYSWLPASLGQMWRLLLWNALPEILKSWLEHSQKDSEKSLPRGEGCQPQTEQHENICRSVAFPVQDRQGSDKSSSALEGWKSGGIHLRHTVHLCCEIMRWSSAKLFWQAVPHLSWLKMKPLAFKAYEEFTVQMEESLMGFVRSVKRAGSSRT